jgi:hypothetical protein
MHVECSLKALILEATPEAARPAKLALISAGSKMHRPEILLGELKDLGIKLPLELAKRFRRFTWTTALRYESGRMDTGETRAFLKTAEATYDWVEEKLS